MKHELRFCQLDEVGLLQDYIAKEWRRDHIFVRSKRVLDFQYLDRKNSRYNVLVAYNSKTMEFDAILGFTLLSQYDETLKDEWVWTSLWSAKKSCVSLGFKLYRYLFEILGLNNTSSAGFSPDSMKFCRLFYNKMDKLYHFYIKNEDKKDFKLAHFKESLKNLPLKTSFMLRELGIKELENLKLKSRFYPQKSSAYFIHRYLLHPIYRYIALGIFDEETLRAVFFTRIVRESGEGVLLIVDFWGDFEGNLCWALGEYLREQNCEFASLLCYVPYKEYFLKMGFHLALEDEILPVYYEPFLKQSVPLYFAMKSSEEDATFFKGDSDQDRPNWD